MKIAIYHNLPSGGGKRALYEMARLLAQRHELDVYALSCSEHEFCDLRPFALRHQTAFYQAPATLRSPLGRLNPLIRTANLQRARAVQEKLAAEIDAKRYDVVFVHNCQFNQSPALLSFLKTPSVYYCGEPPRFLFEPRLPRPYLKTRPVQTILNQVDPLPGIFKRTFARFDRQNVMAATLVLANSAFSYESLYRYYGILARVCYLGVDSQKFTPLDLPREKRVMSVGAIHGGKGYDFLIRSLGTIPADERPALTIVGNYAETAERDYLNTLAGQLGVPLEMRSRVSDAELVELYNRAAVTTYTPIMEPFGFVPLESMACGTPVVGVREGGVRESVRHEQTGILSERDPKDYGEAVRLLLADAERRGRYGQAGREDVVNNWQWERTITTLERCFELAKAKGRK